MNTITKYRAFDGAIFEEEKQCKVYEDALKETVKNDALKILGDNINDKISFDLALYFCNDVDKDYNDFFLVKNIDLQQIYSLNMLIDIGLDGASEEIKQSNHIPFSMKGKDILITQFLNNGEDYEFRGDKESIIEGFTKQINKAFGEE